MFVFERGIWKSTALRNTQVRHAFTTRLGGVSLTPYTKSMNIGFNRGDGDSTVKENIRILCNTAGLDYGGLCASPQYHSSYVRCVTEENRLEGIECENTDPSDGFVTDCSGISVLVRSADCVPMLFQGQKENGSPVVGAVHAGWRGTVYGIAAECISKMKELGVIESSVYVAVGPCIGPCCFEVRDDFIEAVITTKGKNFADRHIQKAGSAFHADLISMNTETLREAGVGIGHIDVLNECTACKPYLYHSHRATGGKRGTGGAVIGIV